MFKIIKKTIKHIFHDITDMTPTGEWRVQYDSPWQLFPTRYDEYKCKCGCTNWIPPLDYFNLYMDKITMDTKIAAADAWFKLGNLDNAISVLKDEKLSN